MSTRWMYDWHGTALEAAINVEKTQIFGKQNVLARRIMMN